MMDNIIEAYTSAEKEIIVLKLKVAGLKAKIRHLESGEKECDYCLEWWDVHLIHACGLCVECFNEKNGENIPDPKEIAKRIFNASDYIKDDLPF